ncbi:hypothetical protein EVAR_102313_1 [Eumeta japonica]|uniref:Uncharacterized protein n=1 Tax=Eumeta variegata TaxID=151549 RepID=A0A4C1WJP1_EUMVA|nr:hypothetical protein EVAR_102313_1 [Eumeta japonica]
MSVHENAAISSSNLQKHITEVEKWTWRIKANQSKSAHVTFTLRKGRLSANYTKRRTDPTVTLLSTWGRKHSNIVCAIGRCLGEHDDARRYPTDVHANEQLTQRESDRMSR